MASNIEMEAGAAVGVASAARVRAPRIVVGAVGKRLRRLGPCAAAAGLEFFRPSFVSTQRNEIVDNLSDIATGIGVSLAHLALAWCLNNPRVCSVALVVRA